MRNYMRNRDLKPSEAVRLTWRPGIYTLPEPVSFHDGVSYNNVKVEVYKTNPYPYDSVVIGVFGSAYQGRTSKKEVENEKKFWRNLAEELGERIALFHHYHPKKKELVLLNGACPGLPQYVADGASKYGGFVAGITAADTFNTHCKIVGKRLALKQRTTHNFVVYPNLTYSLPLDGDPSPDEVIDKLKWRNPMNTEFSDICIALEGSYGTLFEISMALHPNYSIVGVLTPNAKKKFEEIDIWHIGDFIRFFHEKKGKKKNPGTKVIASDDPRELIEELYQAWEERQSDLEKKKIFHPSEKRPFETKIIAPLEKVMERMYPL